jgi:hypothetical protein
MVRLIESGLHDNPQDRGRRRRRDAVIWSSDVTAKVSSTVDRSAMRRHPGRARGSRAARGRHMQETVIESFSRLPQHIGIIPDGNRRWAQHKGLKKQDGYESGLGQDSSCTNYVWSWGFRS